VKEQNEPESKRIHQTWNMKRALCVDRGTWSVECGTWNKMGKARQWSKL